jgi:hypothetical protein
MRLVYKEGPRAGAEVRVGDGVSLRDGPAEVLSIEKPHKPASTGRVYVRPLGGTYETGYYPSVIGAEWIEREDRQEPTSNPVLKLGQAKVIIENAGVRLRRG